MTKTTSFTLTDILGLFLDYLQEIPNNLKVPAVSLLVALITLDLILMGKKLVLDENFNPVKYLVNKTWQFSYLIFVILNYSWLIPSIRHGFKKLASLATGITINSTYISNPTKVIDLGADLAWGVLEKGVGLNPITWSYLLLALLILIAFCMIGFGLVMTWIEYYFLIGISIIFVPFGILDTTEGYYKNIFKTIIGCNIKLFVLEFWLLLCEPIIKDLKVSDQIIDFYNIVPISITLLVLGLILLSLPRLASSILTGSPAMSAGAAMGSAIGGLTMATKMLSKGGSGAKGVTQTAGSGVAETAKGTMEGAKKGGNIGARMGSALGPVGSMIGGTIGTAVGGTVGGAYSGAKFATKKTAGAVKSAFTTKGSTGSTSKQSTPKATVKETPTESTKGATATTGETRSNDSNVKGASQESTTTVSSVDTGSARTETVSESDLGTNTNKSSETISTGETRKEALNPAETTEKTTNTSTGSNTGIETKVETGNTRQGTAEKTQDIGEIKEPKYNFNDIKGTTKINGVEIDEKKKK